MNDVNLIEKGKSCLEQKDYEQAEGIFKEVLQSSPDNEQAYFELGKICCIQQKYAEAIERLEKAISLNHNNTCAHFLLAKAYKEENRYQESIAEFQKTLELNCRQGCIHLDSIDEQAYFELGSICFTEQKYSEAIEKLKKAITLNPNYIFARLLLAKSYKAVNKYQESIAQFEETLKLSYENENIHRELYTIYSALNKFNLAAEELKKALNNEHDKESYLSALNRLHQAQIRLIESYNLEGKYPEAVEEADTASKWISKENLMLQNILQNETEIAQKKISLSCKIRALTVTLTNKCNLACIMCKTRSQPWDLPEKHIKEIIALFPYLERVMWQGGEVFLYPAFKDLLKESSRFPMRKIIATNGLLIDKEMAEIMVKSNVELTFSIDGATKEVYEHIREGARFEKVIENVELINELRQKLNPKMQTRLNVLVMHSNCHQVEQFLDFAKRYKFNTVFFNSTGNDFKNLRENIFCFSMDEEALDYLAKIRIKILKKAEEYGIRLENWLPSPEFLDQVENASQIEKQGNGQKNAEPMTDKLFCHAPWQRLYIDCGGSVRPDCLCLTQNDVGNILESSLEELWNCDKLKDYRRKIISNEFKDFCNPDCVFGRVVEKNLKCV